MATSFGRFGLRNAFNGFVRAEGSRSILAFTANPAELASFVPAHPSVTANLAGLGSFAPSIHLPDILPIWQGWVRSRAFLIAGELPRRAISRRRRRIHAGLDGLVHRCRKWSMPHTTTDTTVGASTYSRSISFSADS
jgi:hypothetical protein